MDIVEVGRSANGCQWDCNGWIYTSSVDSPFVDRSLGIPPANIPPKPGAAPPLAVPGGGGGGGAELGESALPALFALARAFGACGLNDAAAPTPGTGGAAPTGGPELPLLTFPTAFISIVFVIPVCRILLRGGGGGGVNTYDG